MFGMTQREKPLNKSLLTCGLENLYIGDELYSKTNFDSYRNLSYCPNCEIKEIDRLSKKLISSNGTSYIFDKLIFATGSLPVIPKLFENASYRVSNLHDVQDLKNIISILNNQSEVLVIGGGVLGVEVALAVSRHTRRKVKIVEKGDRLLPSILSTAESKHLETHLNKYGIKVITGREVIKTTHSPNFDMAILETGESLKCDLAILALGTRPNIDLADRSGIPINRGIVVNEWMQSTVPDIYAVGDCAELKGKLTHRINQGIDQVDKLVNSFGDCHFGPTKQINCINIKSSKCDEIKFAMSIGDVESYADRMLYYKRGSAYCSLVMHHDHTLHRVFSIGMSNIYDDAVEKMLYKLPLTRIQRYAFKLTGRFTLLDDEHRKDYLICHCFNISKERIDKLIASGCRDIECISKLTSLGNGCGECKRICENYLCNAKEEKGKKVPIFALSVALFIGLMIVILLSPNTDTRIQAISRWEWIDYISASSWSEFTGYSLLALTLTMSLISVRKRHKSINLFPYKRWIFVHLLLGMLSTGTLMLHTGYDSGNNLNLLLFSIYISVSVLGFITFIYSQVIMLKLAGRGSLVERFLSSIHFILVYPLLGILVVHIFQNYYF